MLIVAGTLTIKTGARDRFLDRSRPAVIAARAAPGCHAFSVSADPVLADDVAVYECWQNEAALHAFRQEGPGDDLSSLIVSAAIRQFDVTQRQEDAP